MKRVILLFTLAFVLIGVIMLTLVKSGVSLRAAPYIRPSVINSDFTSVAEAVFRRLFPDLQMADVIVFGIPTNNQEASKVVHLFRKRFETEFNKTVTILYKPRSELTEEDIFRCKKPCWVFTGALEAHQIIPNSPKHPFIPIDTEYFTLTWLSFHRHVELSKFCEEEKRLDLQCIVPVSVKDVERKFRSKTDRYFFMRKYLEQDFFLFIEEPTTSTGHPQ